MAKRLAMMGTDVPPDRYAARKAWLNRGLERAWRAGLCDRPDFDRLLQRADRIATAESDSGWRAALDRLIDSLRDEAALTPLGLTFAQVQLSRLLTQRERARKLWRAHPEIASVPIESPIIVLGHMRSGTTRLQRLLGCDPQFAHTRFFEITEPLAPALDYRILASWAQLRLIDTLNPEIQTVHPTSPRAVEEVFGLLSFSFYGAQFEAQWRVPAFSRWWEGQDRDWVYGELRRLLQTLAWERGAPPAPWVLKAPQFMEDLAPLLAAFPDAQLVCLSRRSDQVVASTASLVCHQMQVQSDAVDRHWIGREWLRKTARRETLCAEARAARPDVPQLEVDFAAVNEDWRGEMRRVYQFVGRDLEAEVEQRMARYLRHAERSGFRGHSYRADDFGLTERAIGAALAPV